jgi:hypothetical protein
VCAVFPGDVVNTRGNEFEVIEGGRASLFGEFEKGALDVSEDVGFEGVQEQMFNKFLIRVFEGVDEVAELGREVADRSSLAAGNEFVHYLLLGVEGFEMGFETVDEVIPGDNGGVGECGADPEGGGTSEDDGGGSSPFVAGGVTNGHILLDLPEPGVDVCGVAFTGEQRLGRGFGLVFLGVVGVVHGGWRCWGWEGLGMGHAIVSVEHALLEEGLVGCIEGSDECVEFLNVGDAWEGEREDVCVGVHGE